MRGGRRGGEGRYLASSHVEVMRRRNECDWGEALTRCRFRRNMTPSIATNRRLFLTAIVLDWLYPAHARRLLRASSRDTRPVTSEGECGSEVLQTDSRPDILACYVQAHSIIESRAPGIMNGMHYSDHSYLNQSYD